MNKNKLILTPLLLLSLTASPINGQMLPTETNTVTVVETRQLDKRAQILSDYFASYSSPLQYHAQDFVDAADFYGVDWKLVPSIAGVESTFGKHIPGGYNAWGWAIYTPDSRYGFQSWRDGIYTVTGGLKKDYIDKGLTDPYKMNKKYAASPAWGWKVVYFMKDLEKFESNYEAKKASINSPLTKTVGASAQLALH